MEPERHPNPLYAYEVLSSDETIEYEDDSADYIDAAEFDNYWGQIFHALADGHEDFENLWEVYERSEKKRKRDGHIDLPSPIKKRRQL